MTITVHWVLYVGRVLAPSPLNILSFNPLPIFFGVKYIETKRTPPPNFWDCYPPSPKMEALCTCILSRPCTTCLGAFGIYPECTAQGDSQSLTCCTPGCKRPLSLLSKFKMIHLHEIINKNEPIILKTFMLKLSKCFQLPAAAGNISVLFNKCTGCPKKMLLLF